MREFSGVRGRSPWRAARLSTAALLLSLAACKQLGGADPVTGTAGSAPKQTAAAGKPVQPAAPQDPRWQRWNGVVAPTAQWSVTAAADVLVLAYAPGLDAEAVDETLRPLAVALRALAGVERVVTRSGPGYARIVVRFDTKGAKGAAAVEAVLAAWRAAPPAGFATPQADVIGRGARTLGALEQAAAGGRLEATRYADAHADAATRLAKSATRSHLAGAVRPVLALRTSPPALASYGVAMDDLHVILTDWLTQTSPLLPAPPVDGGPAAAQALTVARHWTANGEKLAPAPLDRLADVSLEQGEPLREARNGRAATTFWLLDGLPTGEANDIDAAIRQLGRDSKDVFKPATQAFSGAYRFILVAPEGKEPEGQDALSERLHELRLKNEWIVALNAFSGQDGVPEALDVDAHNGRRWTVWASIATADVGSVIFGIREALAAGGWDVHVLSEQTDTALAWALDAWGTGGAVISADDAAVLAPNIGNVALRAQAGRGKAGLRQGPQPGLAPVTWRKIDPKALLATKLAPNVAQRFANTLVGAQPVGWWHDTPVWLGLPVGDLAATVGQTPLNWQGGAGSGPNRAWLASDVLRIADQTMLVDRVRVNGRPALWTVPDNYSDTPQAVVDSFWRLIQATVDMRSGMRVDPMDLREKPIVAEPIDAP